MTYLPKTLCLVGGRGEDYYSSEKVYYESKTLQPFPRDQPKDGGQLLFSSR